MIDKDGNNVALNVNGGEASQSSIWDPTRQPGQGNDGYIGTSTSEWKRVVHTKTESGGRSDLILHNFMLD